jgi:hypothetical protein
VTLLSDGERLTGAYAPGPGAGKWLQQATLAIRTAAVMALRVKIADVPPAVRPMAAQTASLSGRTSVSRELTD